MIITLIKTGTLGCITYVICLALKNKPIGILAILMTILCMAGTIGGHIAPFYQELSQVESFWEFIKVVVF